MRRDENGNSESGLGTQLPRFSFVEKDWGALQNQFRQQLPAFWENCRKGRCQAIETELRTILTRIESAQEAFRQNEQKFFSETRAECMRWRMRRARLQRHQPDFSRDLQPLLSAFERELHHEASAPLRPQLAFCLGGLRRLASLAFPEETWTLPAPLVPLEVREAGEKSLDKTISELQGAHAPRSPAELLARLESLYANWWQAQAQLAELYRKPSLEIRRVAAAARREFEMPITQRIFPVLDALDSALDTADLPASSFAIPPTLLAAKRLVLKFLAAGEIAPLAARPGTQFEPELHHAAGTRLPASGAWRIAKVLRNGYRAGEDILRHAEVETISA